MKDLIHQFYNEGLATTFYQKPKKFIYKHIKNKVLRRIIMTLIIILYTSIVLVIAIYYLYVKLK